jgi:hypothetical protein
MTKLIKSSVVALTLAAASVPMLASSAYADCYSTKDGSSFCIQSGSSDNGVNSQHLVN